MKELLQHIDPSLVLLAGFALGGWYADRRRERSDQAHEDARRRQGARIGAVEDAVAELRGALANRLGRGGDG